MTNLRDTLATRGKTHGRYNHHAEVTQALKRVIYTYINDDHMNMSDHFLSDAMLETLDMTAHKIGRILAGDPNEPDHWRDIAGYNELIVLEIERYRGPPIVGEDSN
jgi:hypothetical protein